MVLQRAPKSATLWGWGSAGATVTAAIDGVTAVNVSVDANGTWSLALPPQEASVNRTVSVTSAGKQLVLADVSFGDVFLCSGQSHSKFRVPHQLQRKTG